MPKAHILNYVEHCFINVLAHSVTQHGALFIMEDHQQPSGVRIDLFWKQFAETLTQFHISAKAIPWYRRHIEGFIADHPDIRLRSHTAESVERWLEHIGRNPHISDWQFR